MSVDSKTLDALAVFASGYAKRLLEGSYDRLMETDLGGKAKALPAGTRYGLEAGLYALMAFADSRVHANTALGRFFKDVALDAPPEIAKRLINGARRECEEVERNGHDAAGQAVADSLRGLHDEELARLAECVRSVNTESARRELVTTLLRRPATGAKAGTERTKRTIDDPLDAARGVNAWLQRARRNCRRGKEER